MWMKFVVISACRYAQGCYQEEGLPFIFEGKGIDRFRLCDDMGSWNYNRLKLEFHQKFYPMHLVHRDRKYMYNFWPREGESIALGGGLRQCYIHAPIMSSQEK